jgi:DNA-binding MarR family transcriptional regulator
MVKKRTSPGASKEPNSTEVFVDIGELKRSLGFSLRRAQLSAYKEYGRFMDDLNVRPAQFAVLVLIRENPGFTQSAISLTLGIQRANFVALLDELERRGWVERRSSQKDRRSFALHLTKQGDTLIKQAIIAHSELEMAMSNRLGRQDAKLLLRLLDKFADAAQNGN